jgi:hypothetical protein
VLLPVFFADAVHGKDMAIRDAQIEDRGAPFQVVFLGKDGLAGFGQGGVDGVAVGEGGVKGVGQGDGRQGCLLSHPATLSALMIPLKDQGGIMKE